MAQKQMSVISEQTEPSTTNEPTLEIVNPSVMVSVFRFSFLDLKHLRVGDHLSSSKDSSGDEKVHRKSQIFKLGV